MPRKDPRTPEETAYRNMKGRCLSVTHPLYSEYGGRGITICERWLDGPWTVFLEDMGPRPGPEYTLDRIDNDGSYSPANCRWATRSQQARNRRHPVRGSKPGSNRETCQRGLHDWVPQNIVLDKRGGRHCAPCMQAAQRAYQLTYVRPARRRFA